MRLNGNRPSSHNIIPFYKQCSSTYILPVTAVLANSSREVSLASFRADGLIRTKDGCFELRLWQYLPMGFVSPQFLQCTEMSFVTRSTSETDESKLSLQPLQFSKELSFRQGRINMYTILWKESKGDKKDEGRTDRSNLFLGTVCLCGKCHLGVQDWSTMHSWKNVIFLMIEIFYRLYLT